MGGSTPKVLFALKPEYGIHFTSSSCARTFAKRARAAQIEGWFRSVRARHSSSEYARADGALVCAASASLARASRTHTAIDPSASVAAQRRRSPSITERGYHGRSARLLNKRGVSAPCFLHDAAKVRAIEPRLPCRLGNIASRSAKKLVYISLFEPRRRLSLRFTKWQIGKI